MVPKGFYTEAEEQARKDYVPKLREQILEHLYDLTERIKHNEDFPHGEQDIDSLIEIDDNIILCLNNWDY